MLIAEFFVHTRCDPAVLCMSNAQLQALNSSPGRQWSRSCSSKWAHRGTRSSSQARKADTPANLNWGAFLNFSCPVNSTWQNMLNGTWYGLMSHCGWLPQCWKEAPQGSQTPAHMAMWSLVVEPLSSARSLGREEAAPIQTSSSPEFTILDQCMGGLAIQWLRCPPAV